MAAHVFTEPMVKRLRLMAGCGHSGNAIARALGVSPLAVRVKACALGLRLRPRKAEAEVRFRVADADYEGLQAAADQRGVTVAKLSRQLLAVILHDDLFNAVIDAPPKFAGHQTGNIAPSPP